MEVAVLAGGEIGLRDGKDPAQPHLAIGRAEWHAFLDAVSAGRFRDL